VMLNHLIEDRALRPSRAVDPGAVWLFRVGAEGQMADILAAQMLSFCSP
jgi:hypothetical protein